jgi:hypothetical protein
MTGPSISRTMWEAVERYHGLTYVAPEVREEANGAGLKGFWMNYFATRVAPVGAVGPEIVESIFFYYGPARVRRAIPDAWNLAAPGDILAARYRGMDRALRSQFGDLIDSGEMREAAELLRTAVLGCDPIGRTLYAGWAGLEWPREPHLAVWHGCTLLREYRSGNHLIAVCAEGLRGVDSVVSHVAVGEAPRAWIRDEAGWSAEDEADSVARLQARGWLDVNGRATQEAFAGRRRIEDLTDALDQPVWDRLGAESGERLFALLSRLVSSFPPDDQLDWQVHYPEPTDGSGPTP